MKEPLIYLVDNDLISKYEIEIRIRQSKRPCKIVSFGNIISTFGMLDSNFGQGQGLPDIIIANFDLPGMDGLSFLKAVEASDLIPDETSLYIFSDFKISDEQKNYGGLNQIKDFFVKPPSEKDVQKIFEGFR